VALYAPNAYDASHSHLTCRDTGLGCRSDRRFGGAPLRWRRLQYAFR
jgi:hypothetical protein